ncbi:MAG: hypothetical protein K6B43_01980 [Treponema sp.]|nr:hypothetical protein [Treponema sp.]
MFYPRRRKRPFRRHAHGGRKSEVAGETGAVGTANLFLTLVGGFVLFATLAGTLAVSFGRGSASAKALSAVFFVLFLVEHLIFAFAGFRQAAYIIITGILFLVYALIFYGVAKAVRQ